MEDLSHIFLVDTGFGNGNPTILLPKSLLSKFDTSKFDLEDVVYYAANNIKVIEELAVDPATKKPIRIIIKDDIINSKCEVRILFSVQRQGAINQAAAKQLGIVILNEDVENLVQSRTEELGKKLEAEQLLRKKHEAETSTLKKKLKEEQQQRKKHEAEN